MSKLVALVSGDREKAEGLAEQYGVSTDAIYNYDNFDDIANNDDRHRLYHPAQRAACRIHHSRGASGQARDVRKKPMAVAVEECEHMIAANEQANRKLVIAYRAQYEPTISKQSE